MKYSFILLLFTIFIFSASLKCKKTPATPPISNTEQLPDATQEGKNTCGFLINGKVWIPKGSSGLNSNMSWYYDAGLNGGSFNLVGRRYVTNENFTGFSISMNGFNKSGFYELNKDSSKAGRFANPDIYCSYWWSDTIKNHNSFVTISKFDIQNRIIAGTFEFTLYKPGCDTVRITQGRFDIKY